MLDIRLLREDLDRVAAALARRGVDRAALEAVRDLDAERRALITKGDELRSVQKQRSKEIGQAGSDEERQAMIAAVKEVSAELDELEPAQADVEQRLTDALARLPNLPQPDAPEGTTEADAVPVRHFGEKPAFDFDPLDHVDLGEALGVLDIPRGVKVAGSRNAFLLGDAVLLEFALIRYTLDRLIAHGFRPALPPVLVREEALFGTGFLPEAADQIYEVPRDEKFLVGTSEVPLAAYHADEILDGADLPIRFAGFSTNFRREAGTYGKDTRGILRVHQFDKVEMFVFARPEDAEAEHERMVDIEVEVLSGLELHGRVVDIAVGDLGASAARKFDCEVWLPGQDAYRELTSCSNCTDYQARRLRCRYRPEPEADTVLVHTLNGTACALGRTIIALLETHQRADGTVAVPEVLQPYLGRDHLAPAGS